MLKEKTFRATKHGTSFGSTPQPATVTTRIIAFLVGNPSKPLLATVTGRGVDPKHINSSHQAICLSGPTSSHVKSELTRPVLANMSLVPCLFTFASFAVLTHFIHRYMYTQKTTSVEMISYWRYLRYVAMNPLSHQNHPSLIAKWYACPLFPCLSKCHEEWGSLEQLLAPMKVLWSGRNKPWGWLNNMTASSLPGSCLLLKLPCRNNDMATLRSPAKS